jgi:hypothetical protein
MSQCRYVTKTKDERCTRVSLPSRDFCWQHDPYFLKGVTVFGFFSFVVVVIGLLSDSLSLCDRFNWGCNSSAPAPTLSPEITASPAFNETLFITPAVTMIPVISSPTETPWAGPCNIDAFEVQPPSPQPVGTFVSIWIKASCIGDVRAIRLMINGEWYSEKGGHIAPPDEFGLNWQTAEYEPDEYQLTAEVATWGDDNWENSASSTLVYVLTEP